MGIAARLHAQNESHPSQGPDNARPRAQEDFELLVGQIVKVYRGEASAKLEVKEVVATASRSPRATEPVEIMKSAWRTVGIPDIGPCSETRDQWYDNPQRWHAERQATGFCRQQTGCASIAQKKRAKARRFFCDHP